MVELMFADTPAQAIHAKAFIAIRASKDVETLPRVLGLIAQRGLIPTQLMCRQGKKALFIDIEVEPRDGLDVEKLIAKLRSGVLVERALLVGQFRQAELVD